jgi:hypothetical protein
MLILREAAVNKGLLPVRWRPIIPGTIFRTDDLTAHSAAESGAEPGKE